MLRRRRTRGAALAAACALALLAAGCPKPPPVVKQTTFSASPGSLRRVAVMPFYPRSDLARSLDGQGRTAQEVAEIVATYVADALAAKGVAVIPPNDLVIAFQSQGRPVPRLDARAAAETAAREFGATAVVLGEVYRWRNRTGEALGSDRPSSVGFQLSLHEAPTGRRLWNSRFDETQQPLTADVRNLRRYPGGGSRWLTASELARWGAQASVDSLVAGQWRGSK